MVDTSPKRWRADYNRRWYAVDDVEFIAMILPQGGWDTGTTGPVEIAFEDSGWLLWRVPDVSVGGAFASDKVVKVVWAT